jgi:hypothetical protein
MKKMTTASDRVRAVDQGPPMTASSLREFQTALLRTLGPDDELKDEGARRDVVVGIDPERCHSDTIRPSVPGRSQEES